MTIACSCHGERSDAISYPTGRSSVEKAAQFARAARMLELPERLRLDLANALAGDRKLLADFLERVIGVHADAKAHAQDALFPRCQRGEHACRRFAQIGLNRRI